MTYSLAGQTITAPDAGGHGLDMSNGQDWLVEDCLIDLSACPLDKLDEAVGVTWGSSAVFRRCVIRGAGKLVLCGSGDTDKVNIERGKTVIFEDCILEDFGRRGPEAQSGMRVMLRGCLIRNWCAPDRFDVRSFGAWAHHGGSIEAVDCVFDQPRAWRVRPTGCPVSAGGWWPQRADRSGPRTAMPHAGGYGSKGTVARVWAAARRRRSWPGKFAAKHILLLTPRLLPSRFSQQQDDVTFCTVCCRVTAHPMCFWGMRPDAAPGTPNLKVPAPYSLRLS